MSNYKDKYGEKQEYDNKKGVDFKEAKRDYYRAKDKTETAAAKTKMVANAQTESEVREAYYK